MITKTTQDYQGGIVIGIDWLKLFNMQRDLDERIMQEHRLSGPYFSERLLALQVEVGELANETRCFKYWSVKPPAERSAILEEYVDGIHFILSIGLVLGFEERPQGDWSFAQQESSMVDQFLNVYNCIANLKTEKSNAAYWNLFAQYLQLGKMLGFKEEDIHLAYLEKNELNHKRQDEGY